MRENRPYGSEGGVGASRSRPLLASDSCEARNICIDICSDAFGDFFRLVPDPRAPAAHFGPG